MRWLRPLLGVAVLGKEHARPTARKRTSEHVGDGGREVPAEPSPVIAALASACSLPASSTGGGGGFSAGGGAGAW